MLRISPDDKTDEEDGSSDNGDVEMSVVPLPVPILIELIDDSDCDDTELSIDEVLAKALHDPDPELQKLLEVADKRMRFQSKRPPGGNVTTAVVAFNQADMSSLMETDDEMAEPKVQTESIQGGPEDKEVELADLSDRTIKPKDLLSLTERLKKTSGEKKGRRGKGKGGKKAKGCKKGTGGKGDGKPKKPSKASP